MDADKEGGARCSRATASIPVLQAEPLACAKATGRPTFGGRCGGVDHLAYLQRISQMFSWHAVCRTRSIFAESETLESAQTASANDVTFDAANHSSRTSELAANMPVDDAWDDYCFVCKEGCDANTGELICCAACSHVYHSGCHVPIINGGVASLP